MLDNKLLTSDQRRAFLAHPEFLAQDTAALTLRTAAQQRAPIEYLALWDDAFRTFGRSLRNVTTARQLADVLASTTATLLEWDAFSLDVVCRPERKISRVLASRVVDGKRVDTTEIEGPTTSFLDVPQLLQRGAQLVNEDRSNRPANVGTARPLSGSILSVPMQTNGSMVGLLTLRRYARAYTSLDAELLDDLANYCAAPLAVSASSEAERRNERKELAEVVPIVREQEQQRLGRDLHTAISQLGSLINLAPIGVAFYDTNGICLRSNGAFEAMFGYSSTELKGTLWRQIFHPEAGLDFNSLRAQLVSVKCYRREHRLRRRDGTTVWALCTCVPFQESRDSARQLVMMVEDFTERKELAEGVLNVREQEQERLGRDLHDAICQNLLGIKFRASLLENKLKERSLTEADDARLISRSLDQAVEAAYNLAKGLQPVPLAVDGLGYSLQDLAANTRALYDANCRCHLDGNIVIKNPTVATHLFRIAQEAVANAIKHSKGTEITINLTQTQKNVVLSVLDNGSGFTRRKSKSKGLGLGIMAQRARIVGGALRTFQRSSGGTAVHCVLPCGIL